MGTSKPGFIFEQTEDVAIRERWFHEFLSEHLELLDEVEYVRLQHSEEPFICFSAQALKRFLAWSLQKGYGDPDETQDKLDLLENAN
jgi:hypothetical protein